MRLKLGDNVIYGANGVCEIDEITSCKMAEQVRECYVLVPVFDRSLRIYVPTDNDKLLKHIRFALTKDEAVRLIEEMPDMETMWIQNESARREAYRKIINKADLRELVGLIKTLYLKKIKRAETGKKLFVVDEVFLKSAEKLLYDELAAALEIKRDDVAGYIMRKIEGTA
jgi:CarD family transcriptional regulator